MLVYLAIELSLMEVSFVSYVGAHIFIGQKKENLKKTLLYCCYITYYIYVWIFKNGVEKFN